MIADYYELSEDEFICDSCGEVFYDVWRCEDCSDSVATRCKNCCICNEPITQEDMLADLADMEYHRLKDLEDYYR